MISFNVNVVLVQFVNLESSHITIVFVVLKTDGVRLVLPFNFSPLRPHIVLQLVSFVVAVFFTVLKFLLLALLYLEPPDNLRREGE